MCRTRFTGNAWSKKSPSAHHHTTVLGYIFATKAHINNRKKLVKQQYLPTCPWNLVNFSPLAAEIVSLVWGTPANFNGFRVLASLLQQHRSAEANRTLHSVWPLPGLVHYRYVYIFGSCCPVMEFCQVQNSLCVLQVLCCPFGSVTAWRSISGRDQTLRHWAIFGRVTIMLGIGPHSSLSSFVYHYDE